MLPKSKLWIEAAKTLVENPNAKVSCPECNNDFLKVKDEPFGIDKIDKYLFCDSCGKWNVLTMTKPN